MGSSRKAGEGLGEVTLTMMWVGANTWRAAQVDGMPHGDEGLAVDRPESGLPGQGSLALDQWFLARAAVPCQSAVLPDVSDEEFPARDWRSCALQARCRGNLVAAQLRHTRLHELHGPEEVRMTPLGPRAVPSPQGQAITRRSSPTA